MGQVPFPYSGSDEINTERNTAAVITGSLTLSGSGNITASGQVQIGPLSEGIPYTVQVNDDIQEFKGQPNKVTIFTSGAKDMSLSETDQVLDPFIVPFALSSSQFQGTGFADTSIDGHTRQFQGNFGEPQIRFGARDLNLPHINSTSGSLLDVAAKRYFNLINTHKKDFVIRGYNSERLAKEYKANHPGTRYTLDSQHFPADFVIKSKKSGHGDINLLNQVEPPFFIESDKPGLSTVGIGVSPFSLDASSTTLTVGGNIKLLGNTRFSDGGNGEDGGLETSNSGFIKTRILTDHKDGILIDCSLTSSRDISLNNNHFNGTNSLLFDSPSSNERRFVNLNVHNTATSHSIVTSNSISSSGAIYGKQRETTCHNHQISSTQKYFIPFVTDQEFVATQQDNDVNVLRTTFVAPNSGKLISMTYHPVITVLSKGQIVGAPVISLFINGAFQGLTNNGFASPNSSHQIILDPTHRRFGTNGGGIFNFQGSANSAEDLLQSSRFRAGDLIRIQIQRSLFPDGFNSGAIAASVNQTLCSLVWEYEYNDEGYP